MSIKHDGYGFWPTDDNGSLLLEIIVVDNDRRESIYYPTELDIDRLSQIYDFDYQEIIGMLRDKFDSHTHTLLIDMQLYREARREEQ